MSEVEFYRGHSLAMENGRIVVSKYGVDERGWPLVPVDPAAFPEGYEVVRVGWPIAGEWTVMGNTSAHRWSCDSSAKEFLPYVIIRPIQKPIRLPLAIVPSGWWIRRNHRNKIFISKNQPELISTDWYTRGEVYEVPQPIAASLPKEWCELPWEQSLMQQTEGGDG